MKWKEEPLLYTSDDNNIHELTILVENSGAYSIQFQPIQTTRDDIIQFPQQNDGSFEVKAGKLRAIPIQVNPANLTRLAETITVRAQNAPSNLKSAKSLRLQALPRPEFKLTPSPVIARHRKNTENVTVDLRVEVSQSQFYISGLKHNQQWVKNIHCLKGPYKAGTAAKVIGIEIDYTRLSEGLNTVKLRFQLRGIPQVIEHEIRIKKEIEPEPARLFVPKMNLEVTEDRQKNLTLTLQNRGERQLEIQNIVIDDPSNLVQLQIVEYPIEISGGEYQNVDLLISAVDVAPETYPYPIDFTISSNCEAAKQYKDVLNVMVKKQEEYPHYLAIDFGTTNSCCAYIDSKSKNKPQLIPLDYTANPPEIMPSSIVYHSNPQNGKTYHVGYEAENYRTSEIDALYYISSVKRWLGYNWKRQFHNNLKLQPCEVVSHIFKHIIERSEEHLDTLSTKSKITKCVVTYPTMFSHRQREDLKRACMKVGIDKLEIIDEGTAASIATIFQKRREISSEDYRLLVYDFGGGTIDIVMSRVTCTDGEIMFEPLAGGGHPKFGGDDVTQAIVDFVLNEFRQRIQRVNPNIKYEIPYLKYRKILKQTGNPKIYNATLGNSTLLYSRTEEMKKELSERTESAHGFTLRVVVGNDVLPIERLTDGDINVSISVEQLQIIIESKINDTFAEIDLMIAQNGDRIPDSVVLAGQSSRLPMVKNMMVTHFRTKYQKDVDIHLSKYPKECVAIGAAQYGMYLSRPTKDQIEIINSHRTNSSIGIMQVDGGQEVFEEIIPKGKVIPDESCGITHFSLRTGDTYIDVREHFGKDDELSPIGGYILTIPENVPREALRMASLQMAVKKNDKIEVIAIVGGKKYKSIVEKKEPAFVDEI